MFKATAQDGLARCGLLIGKHASITTPTPMLYTRRGGCLYLTPDMIEKLRPEAQLIQINTMQFINMPSPETVQAFGRSIHHYLGISSWPVFASNRDPTMAEYLSTKPSNNTAAYVTTYTGGASVTPERYMQAIAVMQPDFFVAVADEVAADSRPKRVKQSVDRTTKWLDECIDRCRTLSESQPQPQPQPQQQQQQQEGEQQQEDAAQPPPPPQQRDSSRGPEQQLFAPVVGAGSLLEREKSAKAAAERAVAGFALCGFGMGELPSARQGLLSAALKHLPADKPKLAAGLCSPVEVLEAVAQGIDLFDCSYPTLATTNGYALCFPLRQQRQQPPDVDAATAAEAAAAVDADTGADGSKINLWSLQYRTDPGPLVSGCSCFACKNHSRAYLHHLLHTHEMLAGVLLELHNSHWWLEFFAAMRDAIRAGQLQQYTEWFKQRQRALQQLPGA